jgi:hypothetical protein
MRAVGSLVWSAKHTPNLVCERPHAAAAVWSCSVHDNAVAMSVVASANPCGDGLGGRSNAKEMMDCISSADILMAS